MTGPVTMHSWEPRARKPTSHPIASAEEVAKRAAELQRRYEQTEANFPGLSLVPDAKEWGSLAIAVAPIGWALIHNSEDHLTQHCTRGTDSDGGPSIPVLWDEETTIPRAWFIPEHLAVNGVRHWLDHGTLAPDLTWSDHCY